MRIIAGEAKRREIIAPKGNTTRPTQDYIRESLFNMIQGDVAECMVFDVFSGSGALGLECLSRGSAFCLFCDKDHKAFGAIKQNVENLHFNEKCHIIKGDYNKALAYATEKKLQFSLVFIDPPYAFNDIDGLMAKLVPLLSPNALVVCEREKTSPPPCADGFKLENSRTYGITTIYFLRFKEN